MLNVSYYQSAFIVGLRDFDFEPSTPAWDLAGGDVAYLVKKSIEAGEVTDPGVYLVHFAVVGGREKLSFIDITDDVPHHIVD